MNYNGFDLFRYIFKNRWLFLIEEIRSICCIKTPIQIQSLKLLEFVHIFQILRNRHRRFSSSEKLWLCIFKSPIFSKAYRAVVLCFWLAYVVDVDVWRTCFQYALAFKWKSLSRIHHYRLPIFSKKRPLFLAWRRYLWTQIFKKVHRVSFSWTWWFWYRNWFGLLIDYFRSGFDGIVVFVNFRWF